MLTDEPTLVPGLYRLPDDPVGPRVFIPGFRSATSVCGAFGWFSAGWIARLAPGLAEYLNRLDTTPIEFTVAPTLFATERTVIEYAYTMSEEEAAQRVADVFIDDRADASALGKHALDCLAWMIATGRLRLRVAVPKADSNYHPKIWLFDDGTHQVLARGSGNATGRGVAAGVEHLDVDVSWIDHSRSRVTAAVAILNDWAQGRSDGIECVLELPEALKQDIINTAPDAAPNRGDYAGAVRDDMDPLWAMDSLEALRTRFTSTRGTANKSRLQIPGWLEWRTGRYAHQGEAVDSWEAGENPERGTIAMATGAGKTLTALVCATRAQDRVGDMPFLVVVSAPSIPLVLQWQDEVAKFGITAIAPSLATHANSALTNLFRRLAIGGTHVLIVTNNLLCSPAFQSTVATKLKNSKCHIATMFVGDEAHTLGAQGFVSNKPDFFERRLALSATPERQYDPDGTEEIFEFFGRPVYEFGLDQAIGFCLTPYNYYVHAATLDGEELDQFDALTRRIGAAIGQGLTPENDVLTRLKIARRKIIETAQAKVSLLRAVLERREPRTLTPDASLRSGQSAKSPAKSPQQFLDIAAMLTELDIRWAPVTQDETSNTQQLNETLATFEAGGYQVLLAKKVLDEGIDIPSVREAFIFASSTVQREWIQRRGRVLRLHHGKRWAIVHDFIALPPAQMAKGEGASNIRKIISSELSRAYSFASHARNATGDNGVLSDLQRIRTAYWPEGNPERQLQQPGDYFIAPATPRGNPW